MKARETPIKILLIENNLGDVQLIQKCLRDIQGMTFAVKRANQLTSGLKYLAHEDFDVIFLNFNLPDSQGLSTYSEVYASAPNIPIVVLSEPDDENSAFKAMRDGAHDYIIKGQVDRNFLERILRYVIKLKQVETELQQAIETREHREGERIAQLQREICKRQQVEQELHDRMHRYRALFDHNNNAIFIISTDHQAYLEVNQQAADMLGYTVDELVGMSPLKIVAPSELPENQKRITTLREKHILPVYQSSFRRKDGTLVPVEINISQVIDTNGTPIHIQSVARDITERITTDEALKNEKERIQQYLDIAGVFIIAIDKERKITLINKKGSEILGYPEEEILGQEFEVFMPEHIRKIARARFERMIEDSSDLRIFSVEYPIITKNGEERLLIWNNSPIKNDYSEIIGLLSSGEDITEQKRSEMALKESEAKYRSLFETARDSTTITTLDGRYIDANPAAEQLVGYTLEELIQMNIYDLYVNPEERIQFQNLIREHGIVQDFEIQIRKKDGTVIDCLTSSIAQYAENGEIIGHQNIIRDITKRKQAEMALRNERDRAQQYLDVAGVILIVIDSNFKITLINKKGCEILGYPEHEILGNDWGQTYIPERLRKERRASGVKIMKGDYPNEWDSITPVMTKKGEERLISWYNTILRDDNGEIIGVLSSGEDITERKRTEDALQEREQRYRALFEQGNDAIFLINPDFLQYLAVNQRAADMLGYDVDELLAINPTRVVGEDEASDALNIFTQLQKGETPIHYKRTFLRKDGRKIRAELNVAMVYGPDGKPLQIQSIARDITAREQAEEALRVSEKRFREFFENAPEYCYMISAEGKILDVNKAALEILGYKKDELINMYVNTLYAPESQSKVKRIIENWNDMGEVQNEEITIITKQGERRIVLLSANTLRDIDGNILNSISIQKDITARKQAEEELRKHRDQLEDLVQERTVQLKELNEELEAFTYSVSHDLRVPLRALYGISQAILEDYDDILHEQRQDYALRLVNAAMRLDDIILDLLTYNHLGRTEVELRPMSLKTVLKEAQVNLEVPIQKTETQITILEPLSYVMGHYGTLLQVVEHLLSNAIKFVEPGVQPKIRIWTEEQKENIRLFIQDNGIGVVPEHQEPIFRLIKQPLDIETYSGTGIGLAILKRGITRMGGSLGMELTPGQGSLFWIDLQKEKSKS